MCPHKVLTIRSYSDGQKLKCKDADLYTGHFFACSKSRKKRVKTTVTIKEKATGSVGEMA